MKKTILLILISLFVVESFSQENENKLDFSDIDSLEKAINLFKKDELFKIYLMPLEFGGDTKQVNTLYVPKFVQELKKKVDKKIEDLLLEGKNLSFEAIPEYKGRSFIPSKLKILVTGDSEFTETIDVW